MKYCPSAASLLRNSLMASSALYFGLALMQQDALALPQGGTVVGGAATISQPSNTQLNINQTTNRAIIDWNSFNIGVGEGTRFYQLSSTSVVLNRVTGSTAPSQILGNLTANGEVAVINANGVLFGKGSQVNVGSLIATSNDIDNTKFMNGSLTFDKSGSATASVTNQGAITAAQGGLVALVAPSVANSGTITANLGTVALGAGNGFTVDLGGDGLYSLAITPGTMANIAATNSGKITAQGGKITMTAAAAANVVDNVVNTGTLSATTASTGQTGEIILDSGTTGTTNVSDTLDASGKGAGQTGGTIEVFGNTVNINSGALLDASGAAGGGHIAIGGTYDNANGPYAQNVTVAGGSTINVSGLVNGSGGRVEVLAKGDNAYVGIGGKFIGKGVGTGKKGGVTEIDAITPAGGEATPAHLAYLDSASIDNSTLAPNNTGTVVADPLEWTVWNGAGDATHINAASIEAILNNGTNFVSQSDQQYTVLAPVVWTGTGSLSFYTGGTMNINANLTSKGTGAISLVAGNALNLNNAAISSNQGYIYVKTGSMNMLHSSMTAQNNYLSINNSSYFYSDTKGVLNVGATDAGQLYVQQNAGGSVQNVLDSIGTIGTGGAEVNLGSGIFYGPVTITKSHLILEGSGSNSTFIEYAPNGNSVTAPVSAPSGITGLITVSNATGDAISDLAVDAGGGAGTIGVAFNNDTDSTLQKSVIRNSVTGVDLTSSTGMNLILNDFNHDTGKSVIATNGTTTATYNSVDGGSGGMSISGDSAQLVENVFSGTNGNAITVSNAAGTVLDGNLIGGGAGVSVTGSNNSIIRNNDIFSIVGDGIDIIASTGVQLLNNVVAGTSAKGIALSSNSTGANITSNTINYTGNNAIDIAGSANATVHGNSVTDTSAGNGVNIVNSSNSTVDLNTVSNAANTDINVAGSSNTLVSGNTVFGGVTGISINSDGGSNAFIDGNSVYYTTGKGILISNTTGASGSGDVAVNSVVASGGDAFTFDTDANLNVHSNKVSGGKGAGIVITNGTGNSLAANTVLSNAGDGIDVSGGTNNTISGNTIGGNGGKGISATNATGAQITGNNISYTGDIGIALSGNNNSTISSNSVTMALNITSLAKGDGISVVDSKNTMIQGNIVSDALLANISLSGASDGSVVKGNTTFFGADGILNSTNGATIDSNHVYYTNGNGIVAGGSSLRITNNTVSDVIFSGIALSNAGGADVEGNTLQFAGMDGIQVNNSQGVVFDNNTIIHPGNIGIYFGPGSSGGTIKGNILSQLTNAASAIVVDKSDTNMTISGNIIK